MPRFRMRKVLGDRPVSAAAATTAQWLEAQTHELHRCKSNYEVEGTLEELEERLDNARRFRSLSVTLLKSYNYHTG
jgi:hypothetical protein